VSKSSIRRAVFTDLDGTLLDSKEQLPSRNRRALEFLSQQNILRVIVTGRSIVSAKRVLNDQFPIDLLVTSTGGEIFKFPDQLLYSTVMPPQHVKDAAQLLQNLKLDFMIHSITPEKYYIKWRRNTVQNSDFEKRLQMYSEHQELLPKNLDTLDVATQLLVICPNDKNKRINNILEQELVECNIVRTTSPLDHSSVWYEILPKETSKSKAAIWICQHHGIDQQSTFAIGNDYNDLDLLRWSTSPYVVENAPSELRLEFPVVSNNINSGFADAVYKWIRSKPN